MAQLRDARTSALIAEGTPLELVLLADELGRDEVLFDDVGEGFNPDAVLDNARQNAAGLDAAAVDADGEDAQRLGDLAEHAARVLELPATAAAEATEALEAARARLE